MTTVAAVILAAGFSSRMVAFKPMLPLGHGTVLSSVVDRLRDAGIDDILVVTGHRAEILSEEADRIGIRAVFNPDFASGMLTSVKAGIAAVGPDASGCLLLPVDIPLIRVATLRRLVDEAGCGQPNLIHPAFAGTIGHPPYIGRALFPEILAAEGRLCDVLARHEAGARHVAVFDRGCLRDMDTPDDYARLRLRLASLHAPDDIECEAMLLAAEAPAGLRAHCHAVADLAMLIAARLNDSGLALDVPLVRAGALLHDIAKGQPDHAETGARILAENGFPDLAPIVASHMDLAFDGRLDEAAVVFLADKLVRGTEQVSLDARFAAASNRFRDNPAALAGARRRRASAEAVLAAIQGRVDLARVAAPALSAGAGADPVVVPRRPLVVPT